MGKHEVIKFEASERKSVGTGPSRALRRSGMIPVVLYNGKDKSVHLSFPEKDFVRVLHSRVGHSVWLDIHYGNTRNYALLREIQYHPVSSRVVSAGFQMVSDQDNIRMHLPLVFVGASKSPGVTSGGAFVELRTKIAVWCNVGTVPEDISVDVSKVSIGDNIHSRDLQLPSGVVLCAEDADVVVCTVLHPQGDLGAKVESQE